VTDALIAGAIAAGQAVGIVGTATASLATDPLREPAVLLLMRVLAATGRAPEALRTGREYRHRLADETGLDPSPALGELERDIAGGTAGPPPSRPEAPIRPTTRLIGREAQVAALHRLLAAEQLVTLVGPGGVGRPGSPWRSRDGAGRQQCYCSHRSPIPLPSRTRWRRL
jgi:DNA-binding SARP family transcriptional activator